MVEWEKVKCDFETAKGPTQVCSALPTGAGGEGPSSRGGESQESEQNRVEHDFGAAGGMVHV